MRSRVVVSAIAGLVTGCAQTSVANIRPDVEARRFSEPSTVLSGVELTHAVQSENLMATLMKFRPWFLATRGGAVLVSVDGLVSADLSILRAISVTEVCEVRLERGTSTAGHSAVLPNGRVTSGGDLIAVSLRQNAATSCPLR